jgi:hypothetical protein
LAFIGITASFLLLTRQLKPIEAITGNKQLLVEYSELILAIPFVTVILMAIPFMTPKKWYASLTEIKIYFIVKNSLDYLSFTPRLYLLL